MWRKWQRKIVYFKSDSDFKSLIFSNKSILLTALIKSEMFYLLAILLLASVYFILISLTELEQKIIISVVLIASVLPLYSLKTMFVNKTCNTQFIPNINKQCQRLFWQAYLSCFTLLLLTISLLFYICNLETAKIGYCILVYILCASLVLKKPALLYPTLLTCVFVILLV